MTRSLMALAASMALSAGTAAAASPAESLAGQWVGEPEFAGSRGVIGLEILVDENGGLAASLSLPSVDAFRVPIGRAQFEGETLVTGIGPFDYDADAATLSGVLPAALVPVHEVPVTFHKGQLPQPPGATDYGTPAVPAWTYTTEEPVFGSPAVVADTVYVGSDDGFLYALESATGRLRWRFETGGAVRARPAVDAGKVLVPSDDGRLYCLDAASGQPDWTVTIGASPAPRSSPGSDGYRYDSFASAAVVDGGTVFVGTLDGEMVALDRANGSERWRFSAGDSVTSTPAVYRRILMFGSFDHHVYAVDSRSGELRWRFDTGAPVVSSPAVAGSVTIIGSRSYDLFGLDTDDGSVRWRFYDWFSWIESSAAIADGTAYIGSSDSGQLRAIRADDGQLRWAFDTPGSAWGTPAVTADRVFIGSVGVRDYFIDHRPGFFAVDRGTGRAVWWYPTDQPEDRKLSGYVSSPAVGGERVYVGGLDGRIYAFPVAP